MTDKNVVEGKVKNAKGHVQELAADVTDNPKLKAKGAANVVAGKAQEAVGHLKDAVKAVSSKP